MPWQLAPWCGPLLALQSGRFLAASSPVVEIQAADKTNDTATSGPLISTIAMRRN
jgi:hypothetical protein